MPTPFLYTLSWAQTAALNPNTTICLNCGAQLALHRSRSPRGAATTAAIRRCRSTATSSIPASARGHVDAVLRRRVT